MVQIKRGSTLRYFRTVKVAKFCLNSDYFDSLHFSISSLDHFSEGNDVSVEEMFVYCADIHHASVFIRRDYQTHDKPTGSFQKELRAATGLHSIFDRWNYINHNVCNDWA